MIVAPRLAAQCTTVPVDAYGIAGTDGEVHAAVWWDPDGAGPATPVLVLGGTMSAAGAEAVSFVAAWDPVPRTFRPLGNPGYIVNALAVMPNGDLVAAGEHADVVRWNGASWTAVGTHNGRVRALGVLPTGELVAGGEFTSIAATAANNIASWNGTTWAALGAGVTGRTGTWPTDGGVHALAVLANGELAVGGDFAVAGTAAAGCVARWNGTTWTPCAPGVGAGPILTVVPALQPTGGGSFVAAGSFDSIGTLTVNNVAQWTGSAWAPFGSLGQHVYALTRLASGTIVAGGSFGTAAGGGLATWTGTAWAAVPGLLNFPSVLALAQAPTGELVVGGALQAPARGFVLWNGTAYSAPADGLLSTNFPGAGITAALAQPDGSVVVGGFFDFLGATAATNVARADASGWHAIGTGPSGGVLAIAALPNGDLVVGGASVTRFNGIAWSPMGTATNGAVFSLCTLADGSVVAGGDFTAPAQHIARWNGVSWSALGTGINGIVTAIAQLPNGDVVAGGDFTLAGGAPATALARWNGNAWAAMGTFSRPPISGVPMRPLVQSLLVLRNGDLVAGGLFTVAGGVPSGGLARFDGTTWSDLSSGLSLNIRCLAQLADGDLLAGAIESTPFGHVLRRTGGSWSAVAGAPQQPTYALAASTGGDVVLGGSGVLGAGVTGYIARVRTTCPPAVSTTGTGCVGSSGAMTLQTATPPMLGSPFVASSTGYAANAVGLAVTGQPQPAVPIAALLPQGLPGCTLQLTLDAIDLMIPSGGTATYAVMVPDTIAFLGLQVAHQHFAIDLGAGAQVLAIASSATLQLQVGDL